MWENFVLEFQNRTLDLSFNTSQWLNVHAFNILVIIIGAWLLRKFGVGFLNRFLKLTLRTDLYPTQNDRDKRLKTLHHLINTGTRVGVYLIAAIMIIGELGIDTKPLLASAGILGLALGFGAQSLIKDFVSGIFIITENQYRVGDIVTLGSITGTVEDVTIRTTLLRDLDGNLHHIPNGSIQITTNKTIGFSRINEDIVVTHDTDIDRLEHVINHVGDELAAKAEFKHVIQESVHFASFKAITPGGLVIKILGTTSAADQWHVRSEMYKMLKAAFEKNDISFAVQPGLVLPAKNKR